MGNAYKVAKVKDGRREYFYIYDSVSGQISDLATRYLKYRTDLHVSPNTVRRNAYSVALYINYLDFRKLSMEDVCGMNYEKQSFHFVSFLDYIKSGIHSVRNGSPINSTCNAYLRDVFGWFDFLSKYSTRFPELKVLIDRVVNFQNGIGIRLSKDVKTFKGDYKEDVRTGLKIDKSHLISLIASCQNNRDRLLLILLAETGMRIGELLGVRYDTDIDYDEHEIMVNARELNPNRARAKNYENRRAKISDEAFDLLLIYLSEYRKHVEKTGFLFVNIKGKKAGKPLEVETVYAVFESLKKRTGIKATPHMLRHYFANERYNEGWDMLMISTALGHKHISTTEHYLNIDIEKLSEASDRYWENNPGLLELLGMGDDNDG